MSEPFEARADDPYLAEMQRRALAQRAWWAEHGAEWERQNNAWLRRSRIIRRMFYAGFILCGLAAAGIVVYMIVVALAWR